MTAWSLRRTGFWWILLLPPAAAWLLPGSLSVPLLPLAASAAAWALPAAMLVPWVSSSSRRDLAMFLETAGAGRAGVVVPELVVPAAAGAALSAALLAVWQLLGHPVPWQTWSTVPFSALTASALILTAECRFPKSGRTLLLLGFLMQASDAPWASPPLFQTLLLQGYLMRSAEWASGLTSVLHGDIFLLFSVLEAAGLLLLAGKLASAGPGTDR